MHFLHNITESLQSINVKYSYSVCYNIRNLLDAWLIHGKNLETTSKHYILLSNLTAEATEKSYTIIKCK